MNTRLNLPPSPGTTVSRVQLSPVTRRFSSRSQRPTPTRANSSTIAASLPASAPVLALESAPSAQRLWSPGLLDRLQAPLTRHRD